MKHGDFLLKIIFWSGMTQAEAARKCNISTPVLNDLVKNRRGIIDATVHHNLLVNILKERRSNYE